MGDFKIYQVYVDSSDFSGQDYSEYGYFRNLNNAITKFKQVVMESDNIEIDVDLNVLCENGRFNYISEYNEQYTICEIKFED